ncbi:MAG: Type III pantothenate kinase [Elusimicrobia bacterium ADurb.Bin231]|jgi:type III pantothenate kinase|nr:MAG: Type III pantothenate kinase [Elusimicrobia bacterium ADurb.Bin231]
MLLVADIGNTNITLGVYKNNKLLFVSRLNTVRQKTDDEYAINLKDILSLYDICDGFSGAVIASVVPELTNVFKDSVYKVTGNTALVVAPGLKTGLKICIDNPKELGADLVASAVGAISKYPLPCLIIDLGTASKLSVINEDGAFLGCAIVSGVEISLDALSKRTSQLPAISLEAPANAIGTNTIDSIKSGTLLGNAAMLDGLSDILENELGKPFKTLVATGGLSKDVIPLCKKEIILNKTLILEGLYEIYYKNVHS